MNGEAITKPTLTASAMSPAPATASELTAILREP